MKDLKCRRVFIAEIDNRKKFVEHEDIPKNLLPSYCSLVYAKKNGAKTNELCIIARVEMDDFSILIPADAPKSVTDFLLKTKPEELRSDVLIAFHHGSEADNNKELIEAVHPKVIIISAGMHGKYHHPSFSTVILYKDYFEQNNLTQNNFTKEPHLLTTYCGRYLAAYRSDMSEIPSFKPVIVDETGYAHGPTSLPLYNTTNGTITINKQLVQQMTQEHTSFTSSAMDALNLAGFRKITTLMLTNLGLSDRNLKQSLEAFPESLTYLDLRKNKLNIAAVEYLLSCLQNHKILIKLAENKPFKKEKLENFMQKLKAITTEVSFSEEGDEVCIDTLRIGKDGDEETAKKNSRVYFEKCAKKIKLDTAAFTVTPNFRFYAHYDQKKDYVTIWDMAKGNKIVIKNPDQKYSIEALHFGSYNQLLALVTKNTTYIWRKSAKGCFELEGTLLFEQESRSCYAVGKPVRNLVESKDAFWLPILSPFTKDGALLATLSKKNCIKIWNLSGNKPKEVWCYDLSDSSVKSIEAFYFIDNDRILRIDFKDGSHCEFLQNLGRP